jgi:hypothetical protein
MPSRVTSFASELAYCAHLAFVGRQCDAAVHPAP